MRFRLALLAALLIVLALAVRALLPRSEGPGSPVEPAPPPAAALPAVPSPASEEPEAEDPDEAPAAPGAEATVVSKDGKPLGDYRIGGVVVDPDGAPVAGAEVMLNRPRAYPSTVRTGAEGRFSFLGLDDAHDCELWVLTSGHPPVEAYASPGRTDLRIVVGALRDVAGVVLMPDGSPAAGAEVTLATRTVTTGADGRFLFAAEPVRTESVVATMGRIPPFGRETAPYPRWRGEVLLTDEVGAELRIELSEIHRSFVRARVVDGAGAPQAKIELYYSRWGVSDGPTGEDGRITIAVGHPAGTTVTISTLDAEPGGTRPRARFDAETAASPAEAREVIVDLPVLRRIVLVAEEADGSPLPEDVTAEFDVWLGEAHPDPDAPRRHDRATYFVHPSPPFHPYVSVTAAGYVSTHGRVWLPETGNEIRYPLVREAAVTGRLVDGAGRAVAEGTVEAWAEIGHLAYGTSEGPLGAFRVQGLRPGPLVLAAVGPDGMRGATREVEVAAGETLDVGEIRLADPVRIAGLVTDVDGRPLGGARIRLGEEVPGFSPDAIHSHADGTFEMFFPADLSAHLLASREGFGTVAVPVDARDAGRVVPVVMPPEARLRLHVLRPNPVTGAWSWAVALPGTSVSWQPPEILGSTRDARLVRGLAPGRLVVLITGRDGMSKAEVVLHEGETTEVTLEIP